MRDIAEYKESIKILRESAIRMEDSGETDISMMVWMAIHHLWVKVVMLTARDTFPGREARENAVLCALRAGEKRVAKDYLTLLLSEGNVMPDQFDELKAHFQL